MVFLTQFEILCAFETKSLQYYYLHLSIFMFIRAMCSSYSRTCLAWKGFRKTNRHRYTRQQPETKSAFRPGDKPLINRWFYSSVGFKYKIKLFVLPKRRSRECSRFAGGQERGLSSCRIDLTASRPIQPRAAPLLRRAPPRPDRFVVCPGFRFDRYYVSDAMLLFWCLPDSRTCRAWRGFTKTKRRRSILF